VVAGMVPMVSTAGEYTHAVSMLVGVVCAGPLMPRWDCVFACGSDVPVWVHANGVYVRLVSDGFD